MFELCSTWHVSFTEFFIKLRCYTAFWKQLLFANDRNSISGAVLGLSQDGACTDLFENLSVNSLKGNPSNATTFKPPTVFSHWSIPLNSKMQMHDKQSLNKNSCSHPGHVRWIPTIKYN